MRACVCIYISIVKGNIWTNFISKRHVDFYFLFTRVLNDLISKGKRKKNNVYIYVVDRDQ